MTTWDEQEAEADRRAAIENEAGERAAAHFATHEALVKALDEVCLEDEELHVEAKAMRYMWIASQSPDSSTIIAFESMALQSLRELTDLVFARLCAEEQRKIERDDE